MIPYVIASWIGFATLALLVIYLPIDWFGPRIFVNIFIKTINPITKDDRDRLVQVIGYIYIGVWIWSAISNGLYNILRIQLNNFGNISSFFLAFTLYFTMVIHSLYKSIKSAQQLLPYYRQSIQSSNSITACYPKYSSLT